MRYKIVVGGDISNLERRVQELIDLGWRPQGGVMARRHDWAQAMVLDA